MSGGRNIQHNIGGTIFRSFNTITLFQASPAQYRTKQRRDISQHRTNMTSSKVVDMKEIKYSHQIDGKRA